LTFSFLEHDIDFTLHYRKKALRALNERLTQIQQKNSNEEMDSIDGWPVIEDENVENDVNSVNNITSTKEEENDDIDSDKNSADGFVKIPKGTDSDPLSD